MHFKRSSDKWRPFCLGPNVLKPEQYWLGIFADGMKLVITVPTDELSPTDDRVITVPTDEPSLTDDRVITVPTDELSPTDNTRVITVPTDELSPMDDWPSTGNVLITDLEIFFLLVPLAVKETWLHFHWSNIFTMVDEIPQNLSILGVLMYMGMISHWGRVTHIYASVN